MTIDEIRGFLNAVQPILNMSPGFERLSHQLGEVILEARKLETLVNAEQRFDEYEKALEEANEKLRHADQEISIVVGDLSDAKNELESIDCDEVIGP